MVLFNMAKETTRFEIIKIVNTFKGCFKMHNLNRMSGKVNSIQYCVGMFGYPTVDEMLDLVKRKMRQ